MILLTILAFALGAAGWTFAEYGLHNWYGHMAKGKNDFSREHLEHHATRNYFTPTPKKIAAAAPVVGAMLAIGWLVTGWLYAIAFTLGFTLMYCTYEWYHRRMHTHAPRGFYSRMMRKHHFYHHFKNPKMNHGVTTPIWDMVFRTYVRPGLIRVPEKHVMDWLCDASGDVNPSFAADYEVARRTRVSPAEAAAA